MATPTLSPEQEAEVRARVEFKMNEILEGVKNAASRNWHIAFASNSQKHQHYWEVFEQLKGMFEKEINMGLPYDNMVEIKRREARDKAVKDIEQSLDLRGRRDYQHKIRIIVAAIEKAQNY